MRNWFISFTTLFTITTLVIVATSSPLNTTTFEVNYILLLAFLSLILSLFMNIPMRFKVNNMFVSMFLEIMLIFIIVFATSVVLGSYQIDLTNMLVTLSLVTIIYIIITLIYLFILTKEAKDMNKKINNWRNKHVER